MMERGKPTTKVDELREALERKKKAQERPESDASGGDDLTAQIHAAEEEAKQHYDKLLRVMAEFENFKKRMAKETEDRVKYANEQLLDALLPTLDNLDRVLDHVPQDRDGDVTSIAEGVDLVRKGLWTQLEKFGLREVDVVGKMFDPSEHEALTMVDKPSQKAGAILEVHRRGYWLGDRLLRPALVTVAKGSQETA